MNHKTCAITKWNIQFETKTFHLVASIMQQQRMQSKWTTFDGSEIPLTIFLFRLYNALSIAVESCHIMPLLTLSSLLHFILTAAHWHLIFLYDAIRTIKYKYLLRVLFPIANCQDYRARLFENLTIFHVWHTTSDFLTSFRMKNVSRRIVWKCRCVSLDLKINHLIRSLMVCDCLHLQNNWIT